MQVVDRDKYGRIVREVFQTSPAVIARGGSAAECGAGAIGDGFRLYEGYQSMPEWECVRADGGKSQAAAPGCVECPDCYEALGLAEATVALEVEGELERLNVRSPYTGIIRRLKVERGTNHEVVAKLKIYGEL